MRVLVAGADGQVGHAVVAALAGHDVLAASHGELDIAHREQVEQVVAAYGPDAVVNCAAITDVDGCERDPERAYTVNALGVRHVAVAADRLGAHVVHVSTDYVFDGEAGRPYTEWDEVGPLSVYGSSKLGGEREVAAHARSWAIARTSWVFGQRGADFVHHALHAETGHGFVDDQTSSPTYSVDLAGVLTRLVLERRAGLYHVTNQGSCTRYELARDVLELAGRDPSALKSISAADLDRRAPRPKRSVLDGGALRASGLGPLRHYRDALSEYVRGDA